MKDKIGKLIDVNWVELNELQPKNVKVKENLEHLKNSLLKHGFVFPFAVWKENNEYYCIDGHTRKQVLTELENDGVEVPKRLKAFEVKAKDRNEAIQILVEVYNQKHNPFNNEVLTEWLDIEDVDIDVEHINIEEVEENNKSVKEDEFDEELTDFSITTLGDCYSIIKNGKELHRLICGDSTDILTIQKVVSSENVNVVFTDPDYSMSEDDVKACYANCMSICNFQFWVCSDKQAVMLASNDKDNFTHFFIHNFKVPTIISNSQPMTKHNMICKFGNRKMNNLKDGFSTIIDVATERTKKVHKQTRMSKRVELPAVIISHYTDKYDIILDIFAHSGSTLIASHQLERKCFCVELEPKYCDFIIKRIIEFDNDVSIILNEKEVTDKFKNK